LYLNRFAVWGRPVERGDGIASTEVNATHVATNGVLWRSLDLDQIGKEDVGRSFAAWVLIQGSASDQRSIIVSFNAEDNATIAAAALALNVSQRFTLTESLTGITTIDYFVDSLRFTQYGTRLTVEIDASRADLTDWPGIWDTGHYDSLTDGRYGI
jgi:hypothetical protein